MKEKDNFQNRKKYFKAKTPTKNSYPKHRQFEQLNSKNKTKIPNKKWAKDLNGQFMKKTYTWPLST